MKTLLKAFLGVLIALNLNAQNCELQSVLTVSTGWDPGTSSVLPSGNFDPMWKLVQSPPPPFPWTVNIGGPAFTIPQSGSWDAAGTSSSYINAFATNNSVLDNWSTATLAYIFERKFCICDPNGQGASFPVTFDLDLHADNWAEVYIEDPGGTQTLLFSQPYVYSTANFTNPTDQYNNVLNLTPGNYKLVIHLRNKLTVMGVVLDGTLTSPGLLADSACSDSSTIAGFKYNDIDQSGTVSVGDAPVSGWTIELYDNTMTLIQTAVTDVNGHYFFNVPPGTYTIVEVPQAGWTMVNPASGTYSSIVVGSNSIYQADFLNDNSVTQDPCEFDLNFGAQIERCGATFSSNFIVPAGFQVVATTWTFGDGYSSNELSPTHYYAAAGQYTVCLEVILFDGKECCRKEVCREIQIEEVCEGGCDIQGDLDVQFDERDCTYDFSVIINSTGVPITNWYWEFGDGTTGNGSTINHQFPGPGTYNVCVTLFGQSPEGEDCCFVQICREVIVECDPCKGESAGKEKLEQPVEEGGLMTPKSEVGNLKLYPNPSAGNFNLMVELTDASDVSLNIVDINGKVVHTAQLGSVEEGQHAFQIDVDLPAGIYICNVQAGAEQMHARLLVK